MSDEVEATEAAEVIDARAMPKPDPEGYKRKCCPLLSSSMLASQLGQKDHEVKECLGPQCMFFVPVGGPPDATGVQKMIDAQCALALIPTALSMINGTASHILQMQLSQQQPLIQPHRNIKR